jgi:hypothetical protein
MTDCEKKLRRMVDGIAEDVVQGRMRFFPDDESVVDDMKAKRFTRFITPNTLSGMTDLFTT